MKYIAIFGYDENTDVAMACVLSEKPSMEPIAYWKKPIQEIVSLVIANQFKPLNFGIDRNKNLQQDNGAFSRFIKEGSLVILAEFVNEKKETVGYRVLSTTNGTPFNMTVADIKQLYLKRKATFQQDNIIFIQNAIVRQYENDITIACYPLKSFEQIEIKQSDIKEKKGIVVGNPLDTKTVQTKTLKSEKTIEFSKKQKKEIELCKDAGVDPKLISNPNLSQEQMRVLWLSKSKKGALAEYFNDPAYDVEVMKFYADILYDEKKAKEYKPILDHPELKVEQVQELVFCLEDGIDITDMIGLSAEDVYTKHIEGDKDFWSMANFNTRTPSSKWGDSEIFDLIMKETARIHSGVIQEKGANL